MEQFEAQKEQKDDLAETQERDIEYFLEKAMEYESTTRQLEVIWKINYN